MSAGHRTIKGTLLAHISLVTSSCVVLDTGDEVTVEEAVVICDWLRKGDDAGVATVVDNGEEARMVDEDERDEAGRVDSAGSDDEARLSTLAGGGDEAGACEAGVVDEPGDANEPDATRVVDGVDIGATHLVQIVEMEVRITVETCVVICRVGAPLDVTVLVTGHEVKVVYTL